MKAFIVKRYGKDEKLHLTDWAEPIVKENDVLVQVHSAGVNLLDSLIRNGDFKLFLPYKPPFVNGHDVAGVVTKVGSKLAMKYILVHQIIELVLLPNSFLLMKMMWL
ncbi:alcohol dehydrogenase catalytic domain-containing protein [Arcicella sp. DC2W]|uniref:Alcohol dehydrogenase catalytic domain-containing protein n=1 Tax=Arcicella gelida TaxID=2984195 RepID=A0ABU5S9S7_9BACT|nr:alcohol dehydrogenase catalytic domain-containing protein [Arcicella sp. DC2W]MEA5405226.1 alcohol dehydrogenase catalytic domain-containing protein [Arcicella sp. DC2W]